MRLGGMHSVVGSTRLAPSRVAGLLTPRWVIGLQDQACSVVNLGVAYSVVG